MNYNTIFTAAARLESAYNRAQDFIRYQCPVIEQRLKSAALKLAITTLELAIGLIDFTTAQLERLPEYRLQAQLTWVNFKRFWVRRAIKLAQLNERYQVSSRAADVWERRGQVARSVGDSIFQLD